MSDLAERLLAYAKDQGGWHNIDETCEEAAARIKALEECLSGARLYVSDALEAYEHSDGRDLLNRIDALLGGSNDR